MDVLLRIDDRAVYTRAGWALDQDILLARLLDGVGCRTGLRTSGAVMALRSYTTSLSTHLGREIRLMSLIRSLSAMRKRYRAFKRFIESPGVVYVVRRNRVHARRAYWRALRGRNEGMGARRMHLAGEPMFKQVRNIFTNNQCAILIEVDDTESFGDSSDEGVVVNPEPPTV